MERHAGVGAHEKASGCAGGGVWEMHKDYFHAQRFQSTGPEAPTTAQLVDQHSPLARRGAVICGLKLVPLNTRSPGPAELCKDDDIIDEALAYLRTDTMHRKWALDGARGWGWWAVALARIGSLEFGVFQAAPGVASSAAHS